MNVGFYSFLRATGRTGEKALVVVQIGEQEKKEGDQVAVVVVAVMDPMKKRNFFSPRISDVRHHHLSLSSCS